jgi:hypothetical protein
MSATDHVFEPPASVTDGATRGRFDGRARRAANRMRLAGDDERLIQTTA